VTVQFIVTGGGGSVLPATVTTNAQGVATATQWTLGTAAGANTLVARVNGLQDQTFTATATAGAPASVQVLSPLDFGTVTVNSLVSPLPQVRVLDAVGNPIAGAVVTWVLDAGNTSTLTGNPATTNASGAATLGSWRVGTVAGQTTTLRAFVTGLDQAGAEPAFFVRTTAGTATSIVVNTGSVQTQAAVALTNVATLPSVRVTDVFGNPVAGVAVEFLPQQGTATGTLVAADANGVATVGSWTMPAGSGARTLIARLVNQPSVQITFTANVP
jgi:adhesin/invasin